MGLGSRYQAAPRNTAARDLARLVRLSRTDSRQRSGTRMVSRTDTVGASRWPRLPGDRKSTRLNSSHMSISYAVFCLKKKKIENWPADSRNFTVDDTLSGAVVIRRGNVCSLFSNPATF